MGAALLASEKDRAEHIMLVDLARNDVNRVCRPSTVKVDQFMQIEKFSHVIHLTSQVSGALREGFTRSFNHLPLVYFLLIIAPRTDLMLFGPFFQLAQCLVHRKLKLSR